MNHELLLELAGLLDQVHNDERLADMFDMSAWLTNIGPDNFPEDLPCAIDVASHFPCGTAGCAMGWTTAIVPGLTFSGFRFHLGRGYECVTLGGFEMAERLFGIDYSSARYLFGPGYYEWIGAPITAGRVASRIYRFVRLGVSGV